MQEQINSVVAEITEDFTAKIEKVRKYGKQVTRFVEACEAAGVTPPRYSNWDLKYGDSVSISRQQLPAIRKILGRLTVDGKCTAYDFEKSNELLVTVKPVSKDFDQLKFIYRTPYRAGGKCHIKTVVSPATSHVTLVCRV